MYPTIRFGQAIIEQRLRNHHSGPHRRLQAQIGSR
jgi:hypothetical protein